MTTTPTTQGFVRHHHEALIHGHEHLHITHYAHGGPQGRIEPMVAVHTHAHNHTAINHSHLPHEDEAHEHLHEAHDHDHAHPTTD